MRRGANGRGRGWRGRTLLLLLVLGPGAVQAEGLRLVRAGEVLAMDVVATDLITPSGLAFSPLTEHLYVVERDAQRISMISGREGVPVIERNFRVRTNLPPWMARAQATSSEQWIEPVLRTPSDLAFDSQGRMYVAERGGQGRLLRFDAMDKTGYLLADIVVTPWAVQRHSFRGVFVDARDRLYITTAHATSQRFPFGGIMMRCIDEVWRLVDYGTFAEFGAVAVDAEGDVLLVAERRGGDVSWYDIDRQVGMSSGLHLMGVRQVLLLRDGHALVTLEREDGTWSLVLLDSTRASLREWMGGLGKIGHLVEHPTSGAIYLSLPREGRVLRLRRLDRDETVSSASTEVEELARALDLRHSLPPREWPVFFKRYVERLDVFEAVDITTAGEAGMAGALGSGTLRRGTGAGKATMTLDEFAEAVPVVAAKFKARLLDPDEHEPDPVEEISFVLLYPNRDPVAVNSRIPGVSLFMARRRSGRTEKTHFLPNSRGQVISPNMAVSDLPETLISVPAGYYMPATRTETGMVKQVFFLGMGMGPDYWIDIDPHNPEGHSMRVENLDGEFINYALEAFPEAPRAGGQSILIAGHKKRPEAGWPIVHTGPAIWVDGHMGAKTLALRHQVTLDLDQMPITDPDDAKAEAHEGVLTEDEIDLRRRIILRAAALWRQWHL